ncbi:MAG: hypothetical protein HFI13_13400 [Lachnospiraceae bacterium]|nr:hypothetical protein [Lachnospiraceae bacterium]
MDIDMIRTKMKEMLEENGLTVFPGEEDTALELDSLRLISIIVAMENTFDIEVPDMYLSNIMLASYNDFCELVISLCAENKLL